MSNAGIEQLGVDTIPDHERKAKPTSLLGVFVGSNLSLSVMVFGWLPILYGLGFWESVSAIVVGTTLGALLVARTSLLGWRAATNNSVASGAYFGVKGRLVASFVGLLLCVQYVALTVWTGGEAISAGVARLVETEASDMWLSASYVLIAFCIVGFALYGYRSIVQLNNYVVVGMAALMILAAIALWPNFDSSYAGDPTVYALVDFWPTWLLAVLTAGVSGPISYVTQTGDWARYVSPKHSEKVVVRNTFVALLVGLLVPTIFGAAVATAAFDEFSFVAGFVAGSPSWLVVALVLIGIVGSLGQGSINLYSMGLDMDAIAPRLTRVQATVLVALVSTSLVFVGRFVFDAAEAVTTSVLVLTVLATSWTAVSLAAYVRTKGRFNQADLQIFNSGSTGGEYWFTGGWNVRAVFAWLIGSIAGLLGISSVSYVGPIAEIFQGIDVSIPVAGLVALALYLIGNSTK